MQIKQDTLANLLEIGETVPEVIWNRFGRRTREDGKRVSFLIEDGRMYSKVLGFTAWLPRLGWEVED